MMHLLKPKLAVPLLAATLAVMPGLASADAYNQCGGAQGKALAAFLKSIFLESAKLCAKGDADGVGPAAYTLSPGAKMTAKFDTTMAKTVDKYTESKCPFTIALASSDDIVDLYAETAYDDQGTMDPADDTGACPNL